MRLRIQVRWPAALAAAALFPVFGLAQQVIENPEKTPQIRLGKLDSAERETGGREVIKRYSIEWETK